jgi:hypothetical protein
MKKVSCWLKGNRSVLVVRVRSEGSLLIVIGPTFGYIVDSAHASQLMSFILWELLFPLYPMPSPLKVSIFHYAILLRILRTQSLRNKEP